MRKLIATPKRFFLKLKIFAVLCIMAVSCSFTAVAESASSYTYTPAVDGGWITTQDAYQVGSVILQDLELFSPRDVFVKDGILYVADTGNARVVAYNLSDKSYYEIKNEKFIAPSGLFVDADGSIYIADKDAGAVFVTDSSGEIQREYYRPESATFGESAVYRPSKIVVNSSGVMYIVSDGAFDGMIQIDADGEFLGYFGYNNNSFTLWDYVVENFFTEAMKDKIANKVPYSFKSADIDKKGLIYSVTQAAQGNALKKHDAAGINLMPDIMVDETDFIDVCVGTRNNIYAATSTGLIFEYDMNGELLFTFGGRAISTEKYGVFTNVSAICCDEKNRLYVLDFERGLVHVMHPTDYATTFHTAMELYNKGKYEESAELWKHIAAVGGSSYYAENSLAQCLFENKDYAGALEHFKIAGNREGYSNCYWQLRNEQISKAIPYVIVVVVLIMIAGFIFKKFNKNNTDKAKEKSVIKDDFLLLFKVLRHPIDSFYGIRREGKGHIGTAIALYFIEYLIVMAYFTLSGFVLIGNADNVSVILITFIFWAVIALFVGSNYLVSSVGEGEARFRDVFIATPYVLSPFAVIMPFVILISHIVTQNELRLLELGIFAILIWVVICLFIATREIHAYEPRQVISNLLITIFLMAVVVLAVSLVYMFCDQLINMIISVVKELNYRVFLA